MTPNGSTLFDVRLGSWPCKNSFERSVLRQNAGAFQAAAIAAISGLMPMMFMTRVRL
jgi:hypothetical protein